MNEFLTKKIPYRAVPVSLETDQKWLSLSLKRRALFLFLVFESVSSESYLYRGKVLTYGQYVWSFNKLLEKFNLTLNPEDQYSRTGLREAIDHLHKIGFLKKETSGVGAHSQTTITILHLDCYELLKNTHRPIFGDHRPNTAQSNDMNTAQYISNEITAENISTNEKQESSKTHTAHSEISLNNEHRPFIQNLTESNTKESVLEDNVQTMPFSKNKFDVVRDNVNALQRFKLSADQIEVFLWLQAQKIDTRENTLCFWAKNYSLKRLKEVHKAAVNAKPTTANGKPKSIGALMTNFLKKGIAVETDFKNENAAFLDSMADRYPLMNWKIGKKFATCTINGIEKEISLNISPNAFVDQFITLENQFRAVS